VAKDAVRDPVWWEGLGNGTVRLYIEVVSGAVHQGIRRALMAGVDRFSTVGEVKHAA